MSDIEVLRKLTKIFNELKKDDEEGHSSAYELQWEDIQAIENLIKEYKDVNKEVLYWIEKYNLEHQKYIAKSKVKEIIYPTPENYIPLEIKQSNMYKKLERLLED